MFVVTPLIWPIETLWVKESLKWLIGDHFHLVVLRRLGKFNVGSFQESTFLHVQGDLPFDRRAFWICD
jgi:hypothetical protein